MKIALPKPAAAAAFGLFAAYGVAHAEPSRLTASSGKELRVVFASAEKPDCTFASMPVVQVVNDAAHGHIRIQAEKGRPNFGLGDPRYFCNEWRIKGLGVYYTSENGYVGDDFATLHFDFGGGDETTIDYVFSVR